jgi:hypothetical protein
MSRLRVILLLLIVVVGMLVLPAAPATAGWNDGHKCSHQQAC